jgi:hypothetical protein
MIFIIANKIPFCNTIFISKFTYQITIQDNKRKNKIYKGKELNTQVKEQIPNNEQGEEHSITSKETFLAWGWTI